MGRSESAIMWVVREDGDGSSERGREKESVSSCGRGSTLSPREVVSGTISGSQIPLTVG